MLKVIEKALRSWNLRRARRRKLRRMIEVLRENGIIR